MLRGWACWWENTNPMPQRWGWPCSTGRKARAWKTSWVVFGLFFKHVFVYEFISWFTVCMHAWVTYMPQCSIKVRKEHENLFSLSTMWVPGFEPRSPGLAKVLSSAEPSCCSCSLLCRIHICSNLEHKSTSQFFKAISRDLDLQKY